MKRIFLLIIILASANRMIFCQTTFFSLRDEDSVLVRLSYNLIGDMGDTLIAQNGKIPLVASNLKSNSYRLKFKRSLVLGYELRYLFEKPKGRATDVSYSSGKLLRAILLSKQVLFLRTRSSNMNPSKE